MQITRVLILFLIFVVARSNADIIHTAHVIDNNLFIATTENTAKPVRAVVLMLPGWVAPLDGVGDIYKRLAEDLAKNGIASLRTNIRGETEREKTDYTLTNTYRERVTDANLALQKMRALYPDVPLGLLGHSLGGSTALSLTHSHINIVDSLALWSMAGNPNKLFSDRLLSKKEQETLKKEDKVTIKRWADITITKRHFDGMTSDDLFTPLTAYKAPLMHIIGSEEPRIENIDALFENAGSEIKEDITIIGADHIYNVFDNNRPYEKRVRALTMHWFVDTLLH